MTFSPVAQVRHLIVFVNLKISMGWEYNSVVDHLPTIHGILGMVLSTDNKQTTKCIFPEYQLYCLFLGVNSRDKRSK